MKGPKILHYESCIGLRLFCFGKTQVEIWLARPGYSIQPHTHANENIKLIFLFGHNIRFHRRKKGTYLSESFWADLKHIGKVFTINAGDEHSFDVSKWPLIFLNIEQWLTEPTSAAQDFQLT